MVPCAGTLGGRWEGGGELGKGIWREKIWLPSPAVFQSQPCFLLSRCVRDGGYQCGSLIVLEFFSATLSHH
jgi:hypothetical protein